MNTRICLVMFLMTIFLMLLRITSYNVCYTKLLRTISRVDTLENEDINSLLQDHDVEILPHLIENRMPFGFVQGKSYNFV